MKNYKGAAHIPLIIAVVLIIVGVFFAKDTLVENFPLIKNRIGEITSGDFSESNFVEEEGVEKVSLETGEKDGAEENSIEEKESVFGGLLFNAKQEEAVENKENIQSENVCDLEKYMLDPEYSLPFVSIISPQPDEELDYPDDWPQDFIYPEGFKLVGIDMGKLTEESAMMYKSFLSYESKPYVATCDLIYFFEQKNWEVAELVSREDLGFIVVLKDTDGIGTGLLNVEATKQNQNKSKVTLSVFPEAVQSE